MWILYFKQFFLSDGRWRCFSASGGIAAPWSLCSSSIGRPVLSTRACEMCDCLINKVPISSSERLCLQLCQGRFSPFDLLSKGLRCAERPQCDRALSVQLFQWPLTFKILCLTGALTAKSSQFSELIWNKDRCLCPSWQEFTVRLRLRMWWSADYRCHMLTAPVTQMFHGNYSLIKASNWPHRMLLCRYKIRPVSMLHMNRKQ